MVVEVGTTTLNQELEVVQHLHLVTQLQVVVEALLTQAEKIIDLEDLVVAVLMLKQEVDPQLLVKEIMEDQEMETEVVAVAEKVEQEQIEVATEVMVDQVMMLLVTLEHQ